MFSASVVFRSIDQITAPVKRMQASVQSFSDSTAISFSRVSDHSKNLSQNIDSLSGKMLSFKTVLMGGAVYMAAKNLYGMAKAAGDAQLQQVKLGQRMGLSLQSVKELNYAFGLQGVGMEEWGKYMERFSAKMGQLKMNTGSLYSFLAKTDRNLLVNLKNTKSVDQAFNLIADAVKRVHDPMMRANLATQAFGNRARMMTGLLMQGSKGVTQAREEYKKLMGQTSISADSIEKFYKAQKRLSTVFSSVKTAIGISVIPAISGLLDKMRDWFVANGKAVKNNVVFWVNKFAEGLFFVVKNLNVIIPAVLGYISVLTALKVASVAVKTFTFAMAAAQYFAAGAMAVSYITTGTMTEALLANAAALKMVTAWEWVVSAATWAFSAALWSTGIPEIVLGIIALGAGIYMLIKHWKDITNWVKTSNNVFAVFARAISIAVILPIKAAGEAIMWVVNQLAVLWSWFSNTGVFKFFAKAFSAAFESVKKTIGWIWDKIKAIFGFISKIVGAVAKPFIAGYKDVSERTKKVLNGEPEKPVNKDVAMMTQKKIIESNSSQKVQIAIDDKSGRAQLTGQLQPVPVTINNTKSWTW